MVCELEEEEVELWPENELPLSIFSRLGDCWRYAPMGGRIGLDWAQVDVLMRQMRVKKSERLQLTDVLRQLAAAVLSESV